MITHPFVKINLGLNVLRKREDGFHDIETLFLPYREISDTLEIIPADDYSRTAGMLAEKYSVEDGTLAQAVSDQSHIWQQNRAECRKIGGPTLKLAPMMKPRVRSSLCLQMRNPLIPRSLNV